MKAIILSVHTQEFAGDTDKMLWNNENPEHFSAWLEHGKKYFAVINGEQRRVLVTFTAHGGTGGKPDFLLPSRFTHHITKSSHETAMWPRLLRSLHTSRDRGEAGDSDVRPLTV